MRSMSNVRRLMIVAVVCALAGIAPAGAEEHDTTQNLWLTERRVANMGHGGGLHEAPQNTLYAFRTTAARGGDVIEADLHMTRDGHIVTIHDSTVNRTTNGTGCVIAHTLEELKQLDAAHTFVPGVGVAQGRPPGDYPLRGVATGDVAPPEGFTANDFTIATLDEVVEAVEANPDALYNFEMKPTEGAACIAALESIPVDERPNLPKALAELIDEYDIADRTLVATFIDTIMAEFKTYAPDQDTSFTLAEALGLFFAYEAGAPPPNPMGHVAVQAPLSVNLGPINIQVTEGIVDWLHEHGIAVHIWTINSPTQMHTLLDWGVDGILTDRPQVLEAILTERGEPRPGQTTYTARFTEQQCDALELAASAFGLDSVAELVKLGVAGFGAVMDNGGAVPVEDPPANVGECEVAVRSSSATDAARVSAIAAAWGVDADTLHQAGGQVVLVLLWRAIVNAGNAAA